MKASRYALAFFIAAGSSISAFWALHEQQQQLSALTACPPNPGYCYIATPTIGNLMP